MIGRIMLEAVKYFSVDILAYLLVSFRLVFFTDDCVSRRVTLSTDDESIITDVDSYSDV